jgi:predicted nicotinamide N-methyase
VKERGKIAVRPEQVKFETITIGSFDFKIRSLKDREQFYDPLGEAERLGISSALWPIFGLIWPSGLALAKVMSLYPIRGKRILELGCGIGLASLVIRKRHGNITASDCHPRAETFFKKNILMNHLDPIPFRMENWTAEISDGGMFDLIIGSDLLYEGGFPRMLSEYIGRHANRKAEVIIMDPKRGHFAKFTKKMDALGFDSEPIDAFMDTYHIDGYRGKMIVYRRDATCETVVSGRN